MNLFKERIQFFISPVIDLLSAMHRVVNHESIYEDVDSFSQNVAPPSFK